MQCTWSLHYVSFYERMNGCIYIALDCVLWYTLGGGGLFYARKVNWFHKACSKTYSWLDRVLQSDLPQMMLSAVWNKSQPPVSGCKSWNIPPPPASCASASLLWSDSDTFCWTWRSRSMWANLEINTPAWVSSLDRSMNTMRYHQDLTSGVWTRLVEKKGRCNRFAIPALVLRGIRGRCDIELSL